MSYILDALRRADSERERGGVPGLHSRPYVPSRPTTAPAAASARWPIQRLGIAVAAGLALIAAYWVWNRPTDSVAPEAPAALSGKVATTAVAASTNVTPAPSTMAPNVPPIPSSGRIDVPAPAPTTRATPDGAAPSARPGAAAVAPERATAAAVPPARPTAPNRAPATDRAVAAAPQPTASPASDETLPTRNELPPEVQRLLPTLAMSGSVYSPQPRGRMVIVDGKLAFEGDEVVPGLVLERILPKSVVMRVQQQRFRVPL